MKLALTYVPVFLGALILGGCSGGGAPTAEDNEFQRQLSDAAKNAKAAPKKNTMTKVTDGRIAPSKASAGPSGSSSPSSASAPGSGSSSAPASSGN